MKSLKLTIKLLQFRDSFVGKGYVLRINVDSNTAIEDFEVDEQPTAETNIAICEANKKYFEFSNVWCWGIRFFILQKIDGELKTMASTHSIDCHYSMSYGTRMYLRGGNYADIHISGVPL